MKLSSVIDVDPLNQDTAITGCTWLAYAGFLGVIQRYVPACTNTYPFLEQDQLHTEVDVGPSA